MKKRKLNVKRVFLIIILVLFIIFALCYFLSSSNKDIKKVEKKERKIIYQEKIEIKVGEEIPSSKDYSAKFTSDIVWDSLEQEENKVYIPGSYKGAIYQDGIKYEVELNVIDDEKPIIEGTKDITISIGDKVDFKKGVSVKDNSKEEIELKIKGDYSIDKEGKYTVIYEAEDSSGNKEEKTITLTVKKKTESKPSNISGKTSKGYDIVKKDGVYYIKGILIANKTYALPSSYNPGGITKEAQSAYTKMKKAASKEGITLKIVSGYRSYSRQKTLYNNYVARDGKKAADTYSARPGHSEHQTGLAFDLNSLDQSFGKTKAGKWLAENAYKYGFILRYPKGKDKVTGYMYEPWHFRYLGDEAKNLYKDGDWITLEEYLGITSKYS